MKKILFIFLFFGCVLSLNATEINSKDFVDKIFNELDINRDGIITESDIKKFSAKEFKTMDTNNDKKISKEEFFDFVCNKSCNYGNCQCGKDEENSTYLEEYWKKSDLNFDGYITEDEKLDSDMNDFYGLDKDRDDQVRREDIEAQLY